MCVHIYVCVADVFKKYLFLYIILVQFFIFTIFSDFGYIPSHLFGITSCIKDDSIDIDTDKMPRPCPPGMYYPRTRGYRKISGDTCSGGVEPLYSPEQLACEVSRKFKSL